MNEHEKDLLIRKHETALFGDGAGNKGIVEKIDAMYEVFNSAKVFGKIVLTAIISLGAVALALTQIWHLLQHYFTNVK